MKFDKYKSILVEITKICETAQTLTEVETKLNLSTPNRDLRQFIKLNSIPMPCYLGQMAACRLSQNGRGNRISIIDFKENTFLTALSAKRFLFTNKIKEQKCEMCGWAEKRASDGLIPVHLHHCNGDTLDWRINNLQVLCPNHHALTENYCGAGGHQNKRRRNQLQKRHDYLTQDVIPKTACKVCGARGFGKIYCSNKCRGIDRHKVDWPTPEQLTSDLQTMSMVKIGMKYGVTDNAVRKWIKKYGFCQPPNRQSIPQSFP